MHTFKFATEKRTSIPDEKGRVQWSWESDNS